MEPVAVPQEVQRPELRLGLAAVFESDRKRDIDLKRLGYTVIRITHRRLREEPAVVAQELRYFLSACGP